MSAAFMSGRRVLKVYPCDWYGRPGWQYDGWAGQTPEEAVHEAALQEGSDVTEDDAFGGAVIVNGITGEVLS